MVMKKDGRKRDIKSKLVAAVCMLLVSCIMMVSSTYAWFTLSTAPEVTGITTAVGANGNLEMALIPGVNGEGAAYATIAEALAAIGNASGNQSTTQLNTTWGNLVDLSDSSYGLNKITLYPSKLELAEGGEMGKVPTNYLSTPKYGADGRFSGLSYGASAAIYNVTAGSFATNGFGVRAVGTSSGMSALELAYRSALTAANNAADSALASAKSAVSTGGSKLASLATAKATGTTTFTPADKLALVEAYAAIETAVLRIETALKSYIIADYLSSGSVQESNYATVLDAMEKEDLATLAAREGVNSAMESQAGVLVALKNAVSTKKTALEALNKDSYAWSDLTEYVTALADVDKMLLNDKLISYYMANNFANLGELIDNYSNLRLDVNGTEGSKDPGFYAQIADFVSTFSTPATISGVSYAGITANNLSVTMTIHANAGTDYLAGSKNEAGSFTSGVFGTGATNLSDFYGYILDMAFRTNATDSYLQLQTESQDRIYEGSSSNPTTMGGGSFISYTIPANSGFSTEKLVNLMSYIRVVFFNPADNSVYGFAKLDKATQEITGSDATGYTVKMQLKMTVGLGGEFKTGEDAAKIVDLVQNTATAVSSMVYLDGENLSNADIANVKLTGTMNIQFSSSAELNPMEYGDLRNPNNNAATDKFDVTVNGQTVGAVDKDASYTYDLTKVTLPDGGTLADYTITVKMAGEAVENAVSDNKVTIAKVTGKIEITVTKTATGG